MSHKPAVQDVPRQPQWWPQGHDKRSSQGWHASVATLSKSAKGRTTGRRARKGADILCAGLYTRCQHFIHISPPQICVRCKRELTLRCSVTCPESYHELPGPQLHMQWLPNLWLLPQTSLLSSRPLIPAASWRSHRHLKNSACPNLPYFILFHMDVF